MNRLFRFIDKLLFDWRRMDYISKPRAKVQTDLGTWINPMYLPGALMRERIDAARHNQPRIRK